jgi:hypothetical protein
MASPERPRNYAHRGHVFAFQPGEHEASVSPESAADAGRRPDSGDPGASGVAGYGYCGYAGVAAPARAAEPANACAAESRAAEAALDRLEAEQARVRTKLEVAVEAGDARQMLRLQRRQAALEEPLVAAKVLAKRCHIAELEAELAGGPRDDYDDATLAYARAEAAYDDARARWQRSRDRLLGMASRLSSLERELIKHRRALAVLPSSNRRPT